MTSNRYAQRSIPRTSQPQDPVGIDWTIPITRGLVSALYVLPGSTGLYDAVANTSLYSTTGDIGNFPTQAGHALGKATSTSPSGIPTIGYFQRDTFTRVFISTIGLNGNMLSESGSTNCARVQAHNAGFALDKANIVNYLNITETSYTPVCAAFVVGPSIQSAWKSGNKVATRSGSVSFTHDAPSAGLLHTTISQYPLLSLHLEWDRELTDEEATTITLNPWQVFQSITRPSALVSATISPRVPFKRKVTPYTKQPQVPTPASADAIAEGLRIATDWIGGGLYNCVVNKSVSNITPYTGPILPVATPVGVGFKEPSNGDTDYNNMGFFGSNDYSYLSKVIAVSIYIEDGSIPTSGGISTLNGIYGAYQISHNTGSITMSWSNIAGERAINVYLGYQALNLQVTGISNGFHTIAVYTPEGAGNALIYIDGVLAISQAVAAVYSTLSIGLCSYGCVSFSDYGIGYIVARRGYIGASPKTAQAISANPWSIFAPLTRQLPTIAATISAPTVRRRLVQRTSQPQVSTDINWANPITNKLISLIDPRYGELFNGLTGSVTEGTTKTITADSKFGQGVTFENGQMIVPNTQVYSNTSNCSMLVVGKLHQADFADRTIAINNGLMFSSWQWGNPSIITFVSGINRVWFDTSSWTGVSAVLGTVGTVFYSPLIYQDGKTLALTQWDGNQKFATTDTTIAVGGTSGTNNASVWWPAPIHLVARWNRELSAEESKSVTENPWQLFAPISRQLPLITSTIGRPNSDIFVSGWSWTGTSLFSSINETTPDDGSYATSPDILSSPYFTAGLNIPLSSGSYNMNVRSKIRTGSGTSTMTVYLLDSSDAIVGTGTGTTITGGTVTLYQIPITVIGTATKVKVALT